MPPLGTSLGLLMSAMAVDAPNVAAGNVIDARKTGRPGLPDYLPLENLAVAMADHAMSSGLAGCFDGNWQQRQA